MRRVIFKNANPTLRPTPWLEYIHHTGSTWKQICSVNSNLLWIFTYAAQASLTAARRTQSLTWDPQTHTHQQTVLNVASLPHTAGSYNPFSAHRYWHKNFSVHIHWTQFSRTHVIFLHLVFILHSFLLHKCAICSCSITNSAIYMWNLKLHSSRWTQPHRCSNILFTFTQTYAKGSHTCIHVKSLKICDLIKLVN